MILTFAKQQTIKAISVNNEAKYAILEQEVEDLELTKLLGLALKQDVQTNPTTPENIKLIEGATFTDCKGNTVSHRGLWYVLAYMVYSHYIDTSEIADTFTGFKTQIRQEAATLQEGTKKRLRQSNRDLAINEFEIIKDFLNQNKTDYPLWSCAETKKVYTPRIYGVRRYGR
jgi:hypothetical protein